MLLMNESFSCWCIELRPLKKWFQYKCSSLEMDLEQVGMDYGSCKFVA